MQLDELCKRVDERFRVTEFTETWPQFKQAGVDVTPFASAQFVAQGNGLLVRGESDVSEVYTAVWPSAGILDHLAARALPGALLVCHYPLYPDGRRGFVAPTAFTLSRLRDRGSSLYILHAPLIQGDRISTWQALARKLGVEVEGTLETGSGRIGCHGTITVNPDIQDVFNFQALVLRVEETLEIANSQVVENVEGAVGRVALVPGDGAYPTLLDVAAAAECRTYITGILNLEVDDPQARARYQEFLARAETLSMNLIGGSQYETEEPGMRVLATWFGAFGVQVKYVEDKPEAPEFLKG